MVKLSVSGLDNLTTSDIVECMLLLLLKAEISCRGLGCVLPKYDNLGPLSFLGFASQFFNYYLDGLTSSRWNDIVKISSLLTKLTVLCPFKK